MFRARIAGRGPAHRILGQRVHTLHHLRRQFQPLLGKFAALGLLRIFFLHDFCVVQVVLVGLPAAADDDADVGEAADGGVGGDVAAGVLPHAGHHGLHLVEHGWAGFLRTLEGSLEVGVLWRSLKIQ